MYSGSISDYPTVTTIRTSYRLEIEVYILVALNVCTPYVVWNIAYATISQKH